MMKKFKPPISKEAFENKTSLMLDIVVETVMERKGFRIVGDSVQTCMDPSGPIDEQLAYFLKHAETWVRWFFVNDPKWKTAILSKKNGGNYGRDWCYTWIGHWADAFLKDPVGYIKKHPMSALEGS